MTIAIKIIGLAHGIVGVLGLNFSIRAFALPETERLSRPRIKYVAGKAALGSVALIACAVTAWAIPSLAWLFALISLISYAPAPVWAMPPSALNRPRYFWLVVTVRIIGIALLALLAIR